MTQITGAVLIEFIGQDLLIWRLLHDERQSIMYSIDSTNVPDVLVAESEGMLQEVHVVKAAGKTIVELKKQSPFYSMLYRRNDAVEALGNGFYYLDSWRFDYQRHHSWLFPAQAVIEHLAPAALQQHLGQWQARPFIQLVTPGIMIEARYRIDAAASSDTRLPAQTPLSLQALADQLSTPAGEIFASLRAHLAGAPAVGSLLAGSVWIGPLIRSNAAPGGTAPAPQTSPDPAPAPDLPPARHRRAQI